MSFADDQAREEAAIRAGFEKEPPRVGQTFSRFINQASRDCQVIAVRGTRYAYDYEMPAGGIYVRVGDTRTGRERSMGRASMPRWVREAVEAREAS